MMVQNLIEQSDQYTSNVWHIRSVCQFIAEKNTLIDTGRDAHLLGNLKTIPCGLGKQPVEQIILTHSHFDHTGLIPALKNQYHPEVYAHPASRIPEIIPLANRQKMRIAEQECQVVYTPGHSEDSLCILCEDERLLFSGDIPIRIYSNDEEYQPDFLNAFEIFVAAELQTIYPGHGAPLTTNVPNLLEESLRNIRHSTIR